MKILGHGGRKKKKVKVKNSYFLKKAQLIEPIVEEKHFLYMHVHNGNVCKMCMYLSFTLKAIQHKRDITADDHKSRQII